MCVRNSEEYELSTAIKQGFFENHFMNMMWDLKYVPTTRFFENRFIQCHLYVFLALRLTSFSVGILLSVTFIK